VFRGEGGGGSANRGGMARTVPRGERWVVLAAGFVVMSVAGTCFSWSLYSRPLMAFFGWSSVQVALCFSCLVFFIGMGALAGGFLHDRYEPRKVALLGVLLWGAGGVLAGLGVERLGLLWLYLTYGAIAGIGCGISYVVPGATVTKWFPEERGLANGIILCGFGLGSLVFNIVVGAFPAFRRVADAAHLVIEQRSAAIVAGHAFSFPALETHQDVAVLAAVFLWSGVAFAVVGGIAALFLHLPPAGYTVPAAAAELALERDFTPAQMLRTRTFYVIWAIVFVNGICGLALLTNAVALYGNVAGLAGGAATIVFGYLSAANGVGRFVWAWLSDFIGRRGTIAACLALQALALLSLLVVRGPFAGGAAIAMALLCFGGIYGVAPAVMAEFYGTKYFGENYAFVITAGAAAGLVGPLGVALLEGATGTLTGWIVPVSVAALLAAFLPLVATRPSQSTTGTLASQET